MISRFHACGADVSTRCQKCPTPTPSTTSFLWGAATSAFQVEGNLTADGRGATIWDAFVPADVGSPDVACNSYYQYQDDIDTLKALGAKAYRFSIAWSRIVPTGSIVDPVADVNALGVAYYNNVIDAAVAAGLTPIVTLYHWDLPLELQRRYNGWLCRPELEADADTPLRIVHDFVQYANVCFRSFGDRVKHWATLNEPQTVAVGCYEYTWQAPGDFVYGPDFPYNGEATADGNAVTGNDYRAAHAMLLAHAAAYRLYDGTYRATQQGRVGIVCNMDWGTPFSSAALDVAAAARRNVFWGGWFWDPVFFGDYPAEMKHAVTDGRLLEFTAAQRVALRGSIDLFMWNTYSTDAIQHLANPGSVGWTFDQHTLARSTTSAGFTLGAVAQSPWLQIVPWGAGECLKWIQNRYSRATPSNVGAGLRGAGIRIFDNADIGTRPRVLDLFITENGVDIAHEDVTTPSEVATRDSRRWHDYYQPYLEAITKAAAETGVRFAGFTAWALVDNLEWTDGFTCRFGITYIASGGPGVELKRVPKDSGQLMRRYFLTK